MKIVKTLVGSIVIFLIFIIIVMFLFLQVFDMNRIKDQVVNELSAMTARAVSIEKFKLSFTLTKGLIVDILGVVIADDPRYAEATFLEVDRVRLDLDVIKFLKERRITASLVIDKPRLSIVKNDRGLLNIQDFPFKQIEIEEDGETIELKKEGGQQGPLREFPDMLIKSIHVNKGVLKFEDHSGFKVEVSAIDFKLHDVSLSDPFDFQLACRLFGKKGSNIQIKGRARLDVNEEQARFDDVTIQTDFKQWDMAELQRLFPQIDAAIKNKDLNGAVDFVMGQMVVGKEGVLMLALTGNINVDEIYLAVADAAINDVQIAIEMDERDIGRIKYSAKISDGFIKGEAQLEHYLAQKNFQVSFNAQDLQLANLIPELSKGFKMRGLFNSAFNFQGSLVPKDMTKSLTGGGSLRVDQGLLEHTNVLEIILSQIPLLPNLVNDLVDRELPDRYKELLKRESTSFQEISADILLEDNKINVARVEFDADDFVLSGKGTITLDQHLDWQMVLYMSTELSQSMVDGAPEMGYLLEQGRIKIPLELYSGYLQDYRPKPDLAYLSKTMVVSKGREELYRLLDKVLDNGEESPEGQSPGRELIDTIFDKIFE